MVSSRGVRRGLLVGAALALAAAVLLSVGTAGAAAATPGLCPGLVLPSQLQPPAGSTLVIDAVMGIRNDEDSGNVGYWALDDYVKHIQVWQSGSSFTAGVFYVGRWHTFAGALSPGAGVTEPADGSGVFLGGYTATLTGPLLASPTKPTHGYIGTFDYAGTKNDVLLGRYGAGQTGAKGAVSWLDFYFPPATSSTFTYGAWGWQYGYRGQQWCNTSLATSGDVVTG